ncbi:SDR family oxidoreductase [Evansella sp. AB-rgal1]|uniref:SDR family oxidoreductase n=1 Tax=Evansella sp. AB-rgal1 TaxID=3242696 RepID=UPI00359E9E90
MNILVTGGTGFVGSTLVKKIVQKQHVVYVLARNPKKIEKLLHCFQGEQKRLVKIIEGDIALDNLGLNTGELTELVGKIDVVYHSAAYLSFDPSDRENLFHVNVEGTRNVLETSKFLGVNKFIHVSTAYTLGEQNTGLEQLYPLESTKFVNAYEESKCHGEHLVMSYKDVFDVTIMRPGIIIGDSETGEADTNFGLYGVLRAVELLKKIDSKVSEAGESVYRLVMDKSTTSHIVPVDYVTKLLVLGLSCGKKNTIYHLTNPHPPTNELVLNTIKEVFEFDSLHLISVEDEHTLSKLEVKVNHQLDVFKDYLNRTITFRDENTKELLSHANEEELQMDKAMLLRIVEGYLNQREMVMS